MKGKIDKRGYLWILRDIYYKEEMCPIRTPANKITFTCGDWCALFGEPELVINEEKHTKLWQLNLCHRTLIFDEFTDER